MSFHMPKIVGSHLALPLLFIATCGEAEPLVSQCVKQFVETCSAATSDPESFVEAFSARTNATVYTTTDNLTRIASVTSATDLESGAGIWERINLATVGSSTNVTCSFDCSLEEEGDQDALRELTFEAMKEMRPDSVIVGGELNGDSRKDLGLIWWGSREFVATGWAQDSEQAALIRLHCCGIAIHSMAQSPSSQ
ncbi:hypothetical protein ACN2XU_12205 [Primorskyibacter sp. 2E107]|uniref:hypothetical protein n=1 Tax=Primorskyibacter sp. 2E107 TaxID=3403458 RepID=UPI003AF5E022